MRVKDDPHTFYHNLGFGKYRLIEVSKDNNVTYDALLDWCSNRWPTQNNDWLLEQQHYYIWLWIKKNSGIELTEFKLTWL